MPQPLQSAEKISGKIPDYEHLYKSIDKTDGIMFKIFRQLYSENKKSFWATISIFIVKNSANYIIPLVLATIIDALTNHGPDTMRSILICCSILMVVIVQNIYTHTRYINHKSKMLRSISAGFRNTLVKKLQQLSISYHNEMKSGKLQSKFLRDMEYIEIVMDKIINELIPVIISIIITLSISFTKSWLVSVCFIFVVPISVLISRAFRKGISDSNRVLRETTESLSSDISEMIEMIPVTKAHGIEQEEIAKIERSVSHLRSVGYNTDMSVAWFGSTSWVVVQLISALNLVFTATLAYKGIITIGSVALFQSYFSTLANDVQKLLSIYPEFVKGAESMKSVSEIMISDRIEDNRNKIKLRAVHGTIQFKNVYFKYPNTQDYIIKNFNLDVEPGECVAFVGSSGSGKSTIMNMIIGFLPATEGSVVIDGKPIECLDMPQYRHFLSVVPQNCILFSGTIRDNILYGIHDISEEELQTVIKRANIDEFINDLPLGLDTVVEEHGANLSGGQKQRISIARALIRNPKIIIFDEATSALDNISEYHVQQAMNKLIKGRTTFIVAHRLSTIREADKIVVMEKGEIAECGTYDELMNLKGKFYELKKLNELNEGKGD